MPAALVGTLSTDRRALCALATAQVLTGCSPVGWGDMTWEMRLDRILNVGLDHNAPKRNSLGGAAGVRNSYLDRNSSQPYNQSSSTDLQFEQLCGGCREACECCTEACYCEGVCGGRVHEMEG